MSRFLEENIDLFEFMLSRFSKNTIYLSSLNFFFNILLN